MRAQTLKSYTGKVKDGYNFWLQTPKKDQGTALKPLVIFLHGASLSGTNLNKVLRYGPLDAIKRGLKLDAYVMAPQTRGAWVPEKIMNDVDYVIEYNQDIDTARIYVVGMSLGGYGTIDLANAYPDRIAAALAFCGGGTGNNYEGLSKVPIWIVHGTADRAVPIKQSDQVVAELKKIDPATPRLIYDRVVGMNHGQPARYFYAPEFYQWLFKHSINDIDRHVAPGFNLDKSITAGVYSRLPGSPLISVGEDYNRQQELSHVFIPAGFDANALDGIMIEDEIEKENVPDAQTIKKEEEEDE